MIVIGLGNPGRKYHGTRHNLGFQVLDAFAAKQELHWKMDATESVDQTSFGPHILLKPLKFMNVSGQAFMQYWKYRCPDAKPDANQILVIHDDLDFPLGEVHEQTNRSAAGHQGVASLIEALGTQNFHRLRIGVGNNRDVHLPAEDYVLQHFSDSEKTVMHEAVQQVLQLLQTRLGSA